MVAPGADSKRAKGPVVVTAYLLHNAKDVLPGILKEGERGGGRGRRKRRQEKEDITGGRRRKERDKITTET